MNTATSKPISRDALRNLNRSAFDAWKGSDRAAFSMGDGLMFYADDDGVRFAWTGKAWRKVPA